MVIARRKTPDISLRALVVLHDYLREDQDLVQKFKPQKQLLHMLEIQRFCRRRPRDPAEDTGGSSSQLYTVEETKVLKFANLLISLYGGKYKVDPSWFSDDVSFVN